MAPTAASISPSPTATAAPLRLVLFGMPDAGKSSLLGAIVQAGQTQEHLLNGHLTPLAEGLAELHRRLYEESPRQTVEEVISYPIVFEPFAPPGGTAAARQDALLIDCDGRVANDLLARRRSLQDDGTDASLARAISEADVLVLVIDASAGAAQVNADFAEFARFLLLLEQNRGQGSEISGLPVFLVLTKCDLLARAGDRLGTWLERIETHKAEVAQRFEAFLAGKDREPVPFGRIDLHLWATAVKRPALADSPARPREPYGVAELLRQALEYGQQFRSRRRVASRRLLWTAAGSLGVLAAMGVVAAILLLHPGRREPGPLEREVVQYLAREQELPPREQYRNLPAQIAELNAFRNQPGFGDLPDRLQQDVAQRLQELSAYQELQTQLAGIADPKEARSEAELQTIDARLSQAEMLIEPYRASWGRTEAVARLYADRDDVKALLAAATAVRTGYQKLVEEGRQVLKLADTLTLAQLKQRAQAVMEQARALPDPRTDGVKPLPGSPRVSYATVFALRGLDDLLKQWDEIRKKLEPVAALVGN